MFEKIKPTLVGTAAIFAYLALSYLYMLLLKAIVPELETNIEGTMAEAGFGFMALTLTIIVLGGFITVATGIGMLILRK